jgi:L-ascorbate metabolism protein UlaG (beta-lactamase superfamily)
MGAECPGAGCRVQGTLEMKFLLIVVAVLTHASAQPAPVLRARFIGQMAFEISDGTTTLMTDFPYQAGYVGAADFAPREIVAGTAETLALITHKHPDHWEPSLFRHTKWKVLGPADATSAAPADRIVPLSSRVAFGSAVIEPLETPHARIGHYSYLVTWHGRRLYFTGDTDNSERLLATKNLDVAFVSPWLYQSIAKSGGRIDARRVVIYHHSRDQQVAGCRDACVVPRLGETLILHP